MLWIFQTCLIGNNIVNNSLETVGIVIPTLGNRLNFLVESCISVEQAGCQNIIIVGPKKVLEEVSHLNDFKIIQDPGLGLPEAINLGVKNFSKKVNLVGWLGDDDLLPKDSLIRSINTFNTDSNVVATYGACSYIDENGKEVFVNRSGKWAVTLMNFLPNLIPQPGSLFKRDCFDSIGGVKNKFPLAFDFELFFELKKYGTIKYIPAIQGLFRWHENSMTVEYRSIAVKQTSQIRKNHLPKFLNFFSVLWEPVIIYLTLISGKFLSKRLVRNEN